MSKRSIYRNSSKVGKSIPKVRKSQQAGSPFLDKQAPSTKNAMLTGDLTKAQPLSAADHRKLNDYDCKLQAADHKYNNRNAQAEYLESIINAEQRLLYEAFNADRVSKFLELEAAKKRDDQVVAWEDKKKYREALTSAKRKLQSRVRVHNVVIEDEDTVPWDE